MSKELDKEFAMEVEAKERRDLFKQVALQTIRIGSGGIRAAMLLDFEWNQKEAERITSEILAAADKFSRGE